MNWIRIFTLLAVLMTAASLHADDAANLFNSAKTAFDNQQYDSARQGFDAFLIRYPNHNQSNAATFYLAESLMYLGQYPQAETHFNRLLTLGLNDPFARAALFRLGEIPYIQGQFSIAKPRLADFVDKLPHDNNLQFVLYYLGDIAMRSDASDAVLEAEFYFEQSVRIFPQGERITESQLGLAWAKNKLGKTTEADAIYSQLINSTNPAVVEQATFQRGVALFERGAFQDAIFALTDFQRRYPASANFADSLRVVARCNVRLNQFEEALRILAQLTNPTPEDMLLQVRCLYGLKRFQDAQSILAEVKRIPNNPYRDEVALLEAVFLYDQKNWAGAIALLESVLKPQFDPINNRMTVSYLALPLDLRTKRLSEENFFRACSLLTLAYAHSGNPAKATALLNEIQTQATLSGNVRLAAIATDTANQLASINTTPGRPESGNRNPNRWPSNNTSNNTANVNRQPLTQSEQRRLLREANTRFRQERYGPADEVLTELIASKPEEAILTEALLLQGKTKYKLGRERDGVALLERIVDEYPNSAEAAEALWFLGLYYESGGDSFAAIEYFQVLADRFQNFKHIDGALYFLAVDDMSNGNGRRASTYLTRIYRNHRNGLYWSHATWTLAYEAFKKKQYRESERYIQEILRHPPDIAILDRTLYLQGELALHRENFQLAFLAFREVDKLVPDSPLSHLARQNARLAASKTVNVR